MDGDGWALAGKKKKKFVNKSAKNGGKNGAPAAVQVKRQHHLNNQNGSAAHNNKFFLPKKLESKLHSTSAKCGDEVDSINAIEMSSKPQKPSFLSIMGCSSDDDNGNDTKPASKHSDLAKTRKSRGTRRVQQRFDKQQTALFDPARHLTIPNHRVVVRPSRNKHSLKEDTDIGWDKPNILEDLPSDVLSRGILPFLGPFDLLSLGACSKASREVVNEGFLWKPLTTRNFPNYRVTPVSDTEWKLAYQMASSKLDIRMRCSHTKKTFLEDIIGLGVNFTVNPRTRLVDYIDVAQDLLSQTAFEEQNIRSDVFGSEFKLFLPLYFSDEHFRRALPSIQNTIGELYKKQPRPPPVATGLTVLPFGRAPGPKKKKAPTYFEPNMILDVIPKIVTTFVVLLSDEGTSACQKSFEGFSRIHRLFLALANEYPSIQKEAVRRLYNFVRKEENRSKKECPNLGAILPLLMIVDQKDFDWAKIRSAYIMETFDRSVLWACKKYPQLEKTTKDGSKTVESTEKGHERVKLTCDAMTVPLRLTMFHVYFLKAACQGNLSQRCHKNDQYFFRPTKDEASQTEGLIDVDGNEDSKGQPPKSQTEQPALLSFEHFRDQVNDIHTITTWLKFFRFVGLVGPKSKDEMAGFLRFHVHNSLRRKYHRAGMDFSKIHASGTSKILAKGQQYSTSANLKRVVFEDHWTFAGGTKFLDATCLLYAGKTLESTVDWCHKQACGQSVIHSGDMLQGQSGTHTINIDLERLPDKITTCVFVISAWAAATLKDILSASVSFRDADADRSSTEPLCTYKLDSHDKVAHLKSVIMCKLYRKPRGGWHILAIGDSNRGSSSNYGPIYNAVQSLL